MKPFLIIVRIGDKSLHQNWLQGATPLFDIFLSYFGDTPQKFREDATYYEQAKGGKWPEIARIITDNKALISQYQAIWLPDDDLLINAADINKMFSFMLAFDLDLAQPALSMNSYFSHSSLLQKKGSVLRLTNFVEVMAPVFSQHALMTLEPTFSQSPSGWGLDNLWPNLLSPKSKIAIIDDICVVHTRPVGGELYKKNPELSPENDVIRLKELYPQLDISRRSFKNKFKVYARLNHSTSLTGFTAFIQGKYQRVINKLKSRKIKKYGA
ncbi:DUF707 domain-containing protein [Chromatiaceae bacterium AAb-1]|nr:DUF707 domain-containing protein [Chromatiaceae bacterium AAb-1]